MAVALLDYVPSLIREVQPPGSALFSQVTDGEWVGYLTDAFWEVRLDGLLSDWVVEGYEPDDPEDAAVAPASAGGAEIDGRGMALVILYAGVRVLRNRILNMPTGFRAKAGPVEYEQNASAATMLTEQLKQLRATKDRVLEGVESAGSITSVTVLDTYSTRLLHPEQLGYYGAAELSG